MLCRVQPRLQPTESLDNGLAMEVLVFPAYPIGKHHVQVVHHFDKLCLAKLVVVIVPTSHLALNLYRYLLEFPVKMGMFSISQMNNDKIALIIAMARKGRMKSNNKNQK